MTSTKIYGPKVFLLIKIKPEYSDILYNPTHFPGPLECRIRQVLTSCTIRHISLVPWCVGLDRFHCSYFLSTSDSLYIASFCLLLSLYIASFRLHLTVYIELASVYICQSIYSYLLFTSDSLYIASFCLLLTVYI